MSYVTMCEQLFCRQSKHSINVKYAYLHMQQLHRKLHLQPLHVGSPSQQTSPCPKGAGICICSASCGPGAGRSCLEAQRRRSTALGRGYVERSKVPWDISNGDALWTRWPTFAKLLCRPMLGGVSRNEKIACLTFEGCMERLHVVLSHKICAYIMHLVSHHRYQCLVLQVNPSSQGLIVQRPMDWSNLADWLIKLGGVMFHLYLSMPFINSFVLWWIQYMFINSFVLWWWASNRTRWMEIWPLNTTYIYISSVTQ